MPTSPEDAWRDNAAWHAPDFLDPETNIVNSAIQTWLLRSEGRTILVDTGVGNHKERPYAAGLEPPATPASWPSWRAPASRPRTSTS